MIEYKVVDHALFAQMLDEYCQLYNTCFNQTMKPEEARWRYLEHPNKELLACFALDDGKLVASYSASPLDIRYKGEKKKAILSLNTMTHPDYTGRGLFVDLAKCVYQDAENRGYLLVFGFPNYISNRTFVGKLDWQDIYEIPTMELNLNEKILNGIQGSYDMVCEDSKFVLDYSGCIYEDESTIAVDKSQAFLQWRYANNPVNQYKNFVICRDGKVKAYIVCKEYKERLNIIDYFFADGADIETLLKWCIVYAGRIGKTMVTLWAKLGSAEHLFLEKLGFKNNYPITYVGAKVFQNGSPDWYDYKYWSVRMGDDNVY